MNFRFILPTALALMLFLSNQSHANLITNGGFETGLTGWTAGGGINTGGTPHTGTEAIRYWNVGSPSYLQQTIATTPGQAYIFDFWKTTGAPGGYEFQAYWGNILLLDLLNGLPTDYVEHTYSVVATDTSTTIKFGLRQDIGQAFLDDVSVEAAPTATPEPSTMVLLSAGIVGVGLLRKKLRQTNQRTPSR